MSKKDSYKKILESSKKVYGGPIWRTFSFIRTPQKPQFAKWIFQKNEPMRICCKAKFSFSVMRSSKRPLF